MITACVILILICVLVATDESPAKDFPAKDRFLHDEYL